MQAINLRVISIIFSLTVLSACDHSGASQQDYVDQRNGPTTKNADDLAIASFGAGGDGEGAEGGNADQPNVEVQLPPDDPEWPFTACRDAAESAYAACLAPLPPENWWDRGRCALQLAREIVRCRGGGEQNPIDTCSYLKTQRESIEANLRNLRCAYNPIVREACEALKRTKEELESAEVANNCDDWLNGNGPAPEEVETNVENIFSF